MKILFILTYPLTILVCMWNGVGEYISVTSDRLNEVGFKISSYKEGIIAGYNEFKNTHKRLVEALWKN